MGDAVIIIGKSSGTYGAEGVKQRVIKTDASQTQENGFYNRKHKISCVQGLGGIRHFGSNFIKSRAGSFRNRDILSVDP